jgi:ABC-type branched-subunit amino acid transport system substrate-binding protein
MVLAATMALALAAFARAEPPAAKIALHVSLSGSSQFAGRALLDAAQFAVDEANAAGASPRFELEVFDDHSTVDGAHSAAAAIVASDALVVLGPAVSPLALVACPDYATAGIVAIDATVHADAVTDSATTFRIVVSTGEIGNAQANYLARVLHAKRAIVLYRNNGYGQPLAAGFKRAADQLGVAASYQGFNSPAERDAAARVALADPGQPPLILGMTFEDAVPVMTALRRGGYRGLLFGTATMARASFAGLFAKEPEERTQPGFFTDGAYAVSPMILDSANAETLAFADRFRARFGTEPSWESVQGYDGATLAMRAVQAALATGVDDKQKAREAVKAYLLSLNSVGDSIAGLTGPRWFTPGRIRSQSVRVGRFHDGWFETAPLQLVPVTRPDAAELASGAVFPLDKDRFARLQRVVSTGVYLNEITRVDLTKSTFGADFYLWERYAQGAGPDSADPTDLVFDNMAAGRFDRAHPAEAGELADGTEFRLWRVQGEFRNDFDLHRYPFDGQTLRLPFFNARAAADRVMYVLDRRSVTVGRSNLEPSQRSGGAMAARSTGTFAAAAAQGSAALPSAHVAQPPIVSPAAFRNLTQWRALDAEERRDNLVTPSALGDPRRTGAESIRELSGFLFTVDLRRRALATLSKTLLPVMLMTLIMFASLYFPVALVKEKITVAITAALTGAVLLASVNSQLGGIGYTIAVEYAFYLFFGLSLLCIVSVLMAERSRVAKRGDTAVTIEQWTRVAFLFVVGLTVAGAVGLAYSSG